MKKIFTKRDETPLQLVAVTALRMAALLRSGVTINRALELLCDEMGAVGSVSRRVSERNLIFNDVPLSFAAENEEPWKVFAASLAVSQISGAPFAYACERMSRSFLKLDSLEQRRSVILAGPKSTVILISALPLVSVLAAQLIGINVVKEFSGALGIFLLTLGILLLLGGFLWSMRMIKNVTNEDSVAGIEMDLVTIALSGGKNTAQATLLVTDCVDQIGVAWVPLNRFASGSALRTVLHTAQVSGSPVQTMLGTEAEALRDLAHTELEKEAERLSVKILLPLGLLVLPSFICVGVLPLVIAMMR